MTIFKPALLSLTLLIATGAAYAAQPKSSIDLNADGSVTYSEFAQAADLKFSKTDTNGDGNLTKEERQAARKLKKSERSAKMFARADTNKDGQLSQAEVEASMTKRDEKRAAKRKDRANKDTANKPSKRGKKARINPDANSDGIISRQEFDIATQAKFTKLDTNADGVLTEDELKKRRKGKFRRR